MTYEVFLASGLGALVLVFGVGVMLGRRKGASQQPRKKAKLPTVDSVKALSHSLHELMLEFVTLVAPWTAPFINAYLIGEAVVKQLGWSPYVGVPAAFAVETIGIQNVTLALKIYEYEQVRSKSPGKTGPNRGDPSLDKQMWIAIGLSGIYFLTVIGLTVVLKLASSMADYAPLGFVLLAFSSVIGIGLKSSAQSAFDERAERLDELAAERKRATERPTAQPGSHGLNGATNGELDTGGVLPDSATRRPIAQPVTVGHHGPNSETGAGLDHEGSGDAITHHGPNVRTSDVLDHESNAATGRVVARPNGVGRDGQNGALDAQPNGKLDATAGRATERPVAQPNGKLDATAGRATERPVAQPNGSLQEKAGLTREQAMQELWRSLDGEYRPVSQLSGGIGRSKSTVSKWLSNWQKEGFIEQYDIENDGRPARWFRKLVIELSV